MRVKIKSQIAKERQQEKESEIVAHQGAVKMIWAISFGLLGAPKGDCFDHGAVSKTWFSWFPWFSWFLEMWKFVVSKGGCFQVSSSWFPWFLWFSVGKQTTPFLNNPLLALQIAVTVFEVS